MVVVVKGSALENLVSTRSLWQIPLRTSRFLGEPPRASSMGRYPSIHSSCMYVCMNDNVCATTRMVG